MEKRGTESRKFYGNFFSRFFFWILWYKNKVVENRDGVVCEAVLQRRVQPMYRMYICQNGMSVGEKRHNSNHILDLSDQIRYMKKEYKEQVVEKVIKQLELNTEN